MRGGERRATSPVPCSLQHMTAIILNVVFAIVGILIAVGIPFAGLAWQRAERDSRVDTTPEPAAQRLPAGVAGYQGPNAPVPNSWATDGELDNANDRTLTRV